jgi:O-antigen/teichoic acid export membrane protein
MTVLHKMASGAAWMVSFKLVDRGLGLISTIVLARLLVPQDFGIVAMAMSIVALIELLGAFNFDMALIQKQEATRDHYDAAWTMNVLLGLACSIGLAAVAWPSALFYEDARLMPAIVVLALAPLVQGFQNVGVVAFRKDMTFGKEFKFLLAKRLVTFFVTIPLAFMLRDFWALIIGIVAGRALSVVVSYWVHPFRPRFSMSGWQDLFGFSIWLAVSNFVQFARTRSADFLLGRMAGTAALGTFSLAFELSNLPTSELVPAINRALFPGYSKVADKLEELRNSYLVVLSAIAMWVLPAGIGLAAIAAPLVDLALGEDWLPAIPLIQVLAVCGAVTGLQSNNGLIYLALGRPQMIVYIGAVFTTVQLALLAALVPTRGAEGAAWAYLLTAVAWLPIGCMIVFRILSISLLSYLETVWRPAVATLGMFFAVTASIDAVASYPSIGGTLRSLSEVLVGVLVGATTYIAMLLLLWWGSGRPQSVERVVLAQVLARVGFLGRVFRLGAARRA